MAPMSTSSTLRSARTCRASRFIFQAEDGIRYGHVTGVQTCALPIHRVSFMPAEKPIMLGIDLGTTNTCVAYVRNKVARVVPSDKGSLILPSVVAMSEKGDLLVGNVAKDQMVVNPRNTIYGAKRLIGRKYNSKVVQDIKHYFSYEIVEGPNGEAAVV